MEMKKNPTYEHDINAKKKNKNTQKYVENHNRENDETDTQKKINFGGQEYDYD
jgi:hypothetical protein